MDGSWEQAVVASLVASKRAGWSFDHAWTVATRQYKPRARELFVPALDSEAGGTLFNEAGEQDESLADALYRFCADAWHGRKPKLRHFDLAMFRDEPGDSRVNEGLGKLAA